ncbi:ras association domain-containing protein 9 [Petromyzon marinus]|nr:ras association domain-containing protein 9 isoform X2 [Petromyzon marinus]
MEQSKVKITVVVGHEEKLVSGLTKRTTCEDVTRALLRESARTPQRPAKPSGGPHGAYCIVERWRGMDRVLPPKTKLLRLWTAWASEQENVHFSLRRAGRHQGVGSSAPRTAEAKVVKSKEGQQQQQQQRQSGHAEDGEADSGLQEKQRRMVRKAFRKLARMNRKRTQAAAADREPSPVQRLETLVRVVLSQDQTIREQEECIRAMDEEIERREAKIHMDRCEREGANYVQDAYLRGVETEQTGRLSQGGSEGVGEASSREQAVKCEAIAHLQDQLLYYEELAARLHLEILEEQGGGARIKGCDNVACAEPARPHETAALTSDGQSTTTHGAADRCRAKADLLTGAELTDSLLEESVKRSGVIQAEMSSVQRDLHRCQATLQCRARECDHLSSLLSTMHVQEKEELSIVDARDEHSAAQAHVATPNFAGDLFTASPCLSIETKGEANDNDSDTGLSSMHSQDSDTVLYMESLV